MEISLLGSEKTLNNDKCLFHSHPSCEIISTTAILLPYSNANFQLLFFRDKDVDIHGSRPIHQMSGFFARFVTILTITCVCVNVYFLEKMVRYRNFIWSFIAFRSIELTSHII
jgi:hypothetical protein